MLKSLWLNKWQLSSGWQKYIFVEILIEIELHNTVIVKTEQNTLKRVSKVWDKYRVCTDGVQQ